MEAHAVPNSEQAAPFVRATTFIFADRLFVCGMRELPQGSFQPEVFLRAASGDGLVVLTEPAAFQESHRALDKAKELAVRWSLTEAHA